MSTETPDTQNAQSLAATSKTAAILEAARAEFIATGFERARLDDIARAAGVGKGTIYLYFKSKEDLFEAVVRGFVVPELEMVTKIIDSYEGPTEDLIRLMVQTMGDKILESDLREIIRLVIGEGKRFPEIAHFYHREIISRGLDMMSKVIARGVARGEFRSTKAIAYPQLVIAPLMLGAIWKMLFDDVAPLSTAELIDTHLDVLMGGLRAEP